MKNLEKFLQKLLNVVWPQVRAVQRIISAVAIACVAHDASLPKFGAIGTGGDATFWGAWTLERGFPAQVPNWVSILLRE